MFLNYNIGPSPFSQSLKKNSRTFFQLAESQTLASLQKKDLDETCRIFSLNSLFYFRAIFTRTIAGSTDGVF
jgi:hypothetical protein